MPVLVTGAGGFIGARVVRALALQGREVRAFLLPQESPRALEDSGVEIFRGDVRNPIALGRAIRDCDSLYHLAALYQLWRRNPRDFVDVNVEGTRNVLHAAQAEAVERVVFTSSIATIGPLAGERLADEETGPPKRKDADHYVQSKIASERLALRFAREEGLPLVVVNPSFPFGWGDYAPTPTGRFVLDALEGTLWGFPPGGFNVIDVDDLAQAHLAAESRGVVGERYLLGGTNISHRDFFSRLAAVAGGSPVWPPLPKSAILAMARAYEIRTFLGGPSPRITVKAARYACKKAYFSSAKAKDALGLSPKPIEETMEQAVAWFRSPQFRAAN